MATTKKTSSKTEPTSTIRVEYDYGTKANKFTKLKERAGKNSKELKARRATRKKPKSKVTAVKEVDLGAATEKNKKETTEAASPKAQTVPSVRPMRTRPYLAGKIIAKHGLAAG